MAEKLDIYSCIDYWFLFSKGCIRGLASRIQWVADDWSTFTVRRGRISGARTEYAKLLYAIENDYLYPYWTIQSYINIEKPTKLLNSAICKTKDLILYIKSGEDGVDHWTKIVKKGGISYFYVVPWSYLRKNHEVKIYDEINMKEW